REAGDAFAHASAHADELGAGTLIFVGRFDLAEFAIVLEPEEPLAEARRCFYAGMLALADALSALAPPETPIAIGWPDALEIERWQDGELAQIEQEYAARLRPEQGIARTIDPGGVRLERSGNPARRLPLQEALATSSWLDPKTGEPRLRLDLRATL